MWFENGKKVSEIIGQQPSLYIMNYTIDIIPNEILYDCFLE